MSRPGAWRRLLVAALVVTPLLAGTGLAHAESAAAGTTACYDPHATLTVEEQRLDRSLDPGGAPVGPELVRLAGFDRQVSEFTQVLCHARTLSQARALASEHGGRLWRTAVDRAQGRRPDLGELDRFDDRPLYWARLQLTKALRQWRPARPITEAQRAELVRTLDWTSRGIGSVHLPPAPGVRRVLVSGFDPFQLDGNGIRRGNPAGVASLRLDGRTFDTPQGRVRVEAVTFPVLWGGFDEGIVEAAYGPWLRPGPQRVDMITTISQGRPEQFDIERWAGRWRGGSPDNDDASSTGPVPAATGWPQPAEEFIETTLPAQEMIDAGTGPYRVLFNREFAVWPDPNNPGQGEPIRRTDEPRPGEKAASGSGGDYLSNESMYRANRVRVGLGATQVHGGHLHVPILTMPDSDTALTDPGYEQRRQQIADQTVELIRAGSLAS
ncbi:hypothetical protein GCM10012275_07210 [Longimycelium tulufanense]|uniref:Pyrrolidone-carboxylate peptidase n=1 Tax=Longimycelium tulufanense TaxID=907463 RepID=A0A8J3C9D8_9PSEU|nr:hypothetical protein [Longimycelium tulufanense]GGM38855.1 hypothetical protein GCM10012275_07210 [Longimycelium tulufanense]